MKNARIRIVFIAVAAAFLCPEYPKYNKGPVEAAESYECSVR